MSVDNQIYCVSVSDEMFNRPFETGTLPAISKLTINQPGETPSYLEQQNGQDSQDKQPSRRLKGPATSMFQKPVPSTQAAQKVPVGILNDFILDALAYRSMHHREEEVTRSHGDTFEWIFGGDQPQQQSLEPPFTTWLAADQLGPIYWITGKPGSGKSTLTQFLHQHPTTKRLLASWAGRKDVVTAGFFFWTSGSREQRSQTGLLRYLLHQLLSEHPELTPLTFPGLWAKLCGMTTKERIQLQLEWTVPELMAAFESFVDAALPEMKMCLFIDGLDEFEGNHLEIINFFKDLGLGKHGHSIKMCLSSRPWVVFQEAFQYEVPNLRLQDLTYGDMYRYSRDRLRERTHVLRLLEKHAEHEDALVNKMVRRADGVFLWVRLAADTMLDRFEPGHDINDLDNMVLSLPSELDELFEKFIFKDQDGEQISQTATLFLLIRAREIVADFVRDESSNSLKVWELAWALKKQDDDLAAKGTVKEASSSLIQTRCRTTVTTIRRRFAGLLDLHSRQREGNLLGPRATAGDDDGDDDTYHALATAESRVTYIHRTVRDWLMDNAGVRGRLASLAPPGFDAHLRLLRSYVLRLKRPLEQVEHHRRLDEWWPDVVLAMTHARLADDVEVGPRGGGAQRVLLNELNVTLAWYWRRKPRDPYDHWARAAFGSYEMRMQAAPIWQPFLCLAAKFGLARYLREELEARNAEDRKKGISEEQLELETDDATPLLTYATEFLCSRMKTIFPLSSPELVSHLLRSPSRINRGANHEYSDFVTRKPATPWLALLRHLRDARRRGWIEHYDTDAQGTRRWAAVARMFVEEGGADPGAVVVADRWDPEISARGVVQLLEKTYGAVEVRELKGVMEGGEAGAVQGGRKGEGEG